MPSVHLAYNSKPPKSVREAPHSKFVCSLYFGKIGHTYLSIPFNIGRWSRVGDHSSPDRSPGVRREIPPTEQDAITMRMPFTFDDGAKGNVQGEIDRATGRVSLQTQLANTFSLQALP